MVILLLVPFIVCKLNLPAYFLKHLLFGSHEEEVFESYWSWVCWCWL